MRVLRRIDFIHKLTNFNTVKKKSKRNVAVTNFIKMVDDLKPVGDYNYDLKQAYYVNKLQPTDKEMEGINAGLKDIEEGRIVSQKEAKIRIAKKLKDLGLND